MTLSNLQPQGVRRGFTWLKPQQQTLRKKLSIT
jgi:hypothetical protein